MHRLMPPVIPILSGDIGTAADQKEGGAIVKNICFLVGILVVSAIFVGGPGCHLLLPFSSTPITTYAPYKATAQVYRALPGGQEFTENWEMYGWPPPEDRDGDGDIDSADTVAYFRGHLQQYIWDYMAPGFSWQYRNLTVVSDTEHKYVGDWAPNAGGIPSDPPLTFGAPVGAEIVWTDPDSSRASAWCQLFYEEGNGIATPAVHKAVMRFAERGGYPDMWTGVYDPQKRHLRFSDMYVELENFDLDNPDDAHVTGVFVQSYGTPFARGDGSPNYDFSTDDTATFYFSANGEVASETGVTQLFFNNDELTSVFERQNASPVFDLTLLADVENTEGTLIASVMFALHSPAGTLFVKHQPYLELADRTTTNRVVTLTPDVALDKDNDLGRFLWFEDFERSTEHFLGQGQTIPDVTFALGTHEITVVAYDSRGAYNSATMTLDVRTLPPVARCKNVTVSADASCQGYASVDDGSYDPEGGALTFVQTPAEPYPLGTTSVTLQVSDPDGGVASCTAQVTVEDATNPSVSCPANIEVNTAAGTCSALVNFTLPTGSDNCGVASVVASPPSGSAFPKGTTAVLVTATDTSGLQGTCTFNVAVMDHEPPTIVCPPSMTVNATSPSGAVVNFPLATASDNCPASLTRSCAPASGSTFAIGTTTDTCTADDGSGNTATCTFTVKVKSAAEQLADLIAVVQGLTAPKLDPGIRTAMLVKLQAALASVNPPNTALACQALQDFISMVNAQSGKKIATSDATFLINEATRIRAVLGCS